MATSEELARLVVRLEAQTAQYDKALRQATRRSNNFARQLQRNLRRARRAFQVFTGVVAGAGLVRAFGDIVNAADRFQKIEDRLGITTEAISELSFAAEQSGVSTRTLELGLQRLQRRVAEAAQGTGEAQNAIRELGIDAERLAALPLDQQFEVVGEALSQVGNESDRTRLAFKLFDSEGVALLQTLRGGARGIQEFRNRARELGLTVSGETAEAAADLKDNIGELSAAFDGLGNALLDRVAPALSAVVREFTDLVDAKTLVELEEDLQRLQSLAELQSAGGIVTPALELTLNEILDTSREIDAILNRNTGETAIEVALDNVAKKADEAKDTIAEIPDILLGRRASEASLATNRILQGLEQIEDAEPGISRVGDTLADAFSRAATQAEGFDSFLGDVFQSLTRIATRLAADALFGNIFGGLFGGGGGGTFGGFFARGGTLGAGKWGIAGEAGPEVVMGPAKIAPMNTSTGGVTINQNVNATGADAEVRRALPVLLEQSKQATVIEVQKLIQQGRL